MTDLFRHGHGCFKEMTLLEMMRFGKLPWQILTSSVLYIKNP